MRPYIAIIRNDIRLALRQKTVIFFNYLMPLAFFFIFAQSFHAEQGGAILQVVTMVSVIGILGNGLFGAGMRSVQDREANILRRYKVAPISPMPLLVAAIITGLMIYLPYILLMLSLAKYRYGMETPANLTSVMLFITLGLIALRSIGLIIASVVNSMQESGILVQIVYMTMLFLSGATFPTAMFPAWLLTATQFIPSTWLVTGLQGILVNHESIANNWQAVGALLATTTVGLLLSVKLFRWEKEEKTRPAAKLWVVAVLVPFLLLGSWQAYAKDNIRKIKVLDRESSRSRTILIRNARVFIGDGKVIENGAVLVKNGRIAEVYDGNVPDEKSLSAQPVEAAGTTILPGLIDTHVHLGSPGGFMEASDWQKYDANKAIQRSLAAYLYSGVTAVRSLGDQLDVALLARQTINSGEKLGAELFVAGPLFTTAGGHGTEYAERMPAFMRDQFNAGFLRMPKTPDEARQQVGVLKREGVDAIKAILETGAGQITFNRLDPQILNAIAAAAKANGLPLAVHTGDARDVEDAIGAGASSIEHGSIRQAIPDADFNAMAKGGIAYDPTLSVGAAFADFAQGRLDVLNRSLVLQTVPRELVAGTRKMMESSETAKMRESIGKYPASNGIAADNLRRAFNAGVTLVTGSDAGNPLVFHGPTVQQELELWVAAGIPPAVALQAATLNAARVLKADQRFGSIDKGKEASLLIVDGNPLQDIHATESISFVLFKGERVNRAELFQQK
jgi:imidazolonepropionase-like amidohydrolase/ABC-type multidrug transport system permease subunit